MTVMKRVRSVRPIRTTCPVCGAEAMVTEWVRRDGDGYRRAEVTTCPSCGMESTDDGRCGH
ncbi:hypothetical protein [Candidatus Methanoprimaticola sp. MG2]|uniref:hypothetical protein n=1 Tax=Candidatus Methanoprimaticola sp. MG2 TaxID=3228838 RepID=UPI0039C65A13